MFVLNNFNWFGLTLVTKCIRESVDKDKTSYVNVLPICYNVMT